MTGCAEEEGSPVAFHLFSKHLLSSSCGAGRYFTGLERSVNPRPHAEASTSVQDGWRAGLYRAWSKIWEGTMWWEKLRKLTKLAFYKVTEIIWQGRGATRRDREKHGMCVELLQGEGRGQRGMGQVRWTRDSLSLKPIVTVTGCYLINRQWCLIEGNAYVCTNIKDWIEKYIEGQWTAFSHSGMPANKCRRKEWTRKSPLDNLQSINCCREEYHGLLNQWRKIQRETEDWHKVSPCKVHSNYKWINSDLTVEEWGRQHRKQETEINITSNAPSHHVSPDVGLGAKHHFSDIPAGNAQLSQIMRHCRTDPNRGRSTPQ